VLEFRILGPLEVLVDGRPARLGGPKQRAALAILLLDANRVVSVERLADDLYAGAPPVTAVTQVQRQVSELRKVLGADAIETRTPGYVLHVERGALDLMRFEQSAHEAARALERSDAQAALAEIRQGLDLWRGSPLADFAYDSFAQTAIARLEEIRLAALELRFDAELELGRHAQLLGELEQLVWAHPLRERLRGQLMLALYRSGRQADALEAYRTTRAALVEEFGIEPSRTLVELQHRILVQDPSLDPSPAAPSPAPSVEERTVLAAVTADDTLGPLIALAEPLTSLPGRQLIVARLVVEERDVAPAAEALRGHAGAARTAAFTSLEPARDVVRLARNYDVELVLVDAAAVDLGTLVEHSPADVAAVHGGDPDWSRGGIYVPFGGGANDWAALELGAWLSSSRHATLHLVGTSGEPARGRRDASRLLADASLAVQRVVGIAAVPLLVEPTEEALLAVVAPASVVVAGLPARFRAEGLGPLRAALVAGAAAPVVLVHRGTRPGGLAPHDSWTRFSWSLEPTSGA
jgi:DNA-binding SARP family transcriptional activator